MQSLLATGGTTWLGGANETGDAGFHWITGEAFSFTKLPANPTLPALFNCIELSATGAWSLADCQVATASTPICEFDLVMTAPAFVQASAPSAIAMGQLEGDSLPEGVVTANSAASTVTVRRGDFGLGLDAAKTIAVGPAPRGDRDRRSR